METAIKVMVLIIMLAGGLYVGWAMATVVAWFGIEKQ